MSNKTKSARDFVACDMAAEYPKSATAHISGLCMIVESLEITIQRLDREKTEMYEALTEVMSWVDNWEPPFVEDDEWPETKTKVEQALKKARGEQ